MTGGTTALTTSVKRKLPLLLGEIWWGLRPPLRKLRAAVVIFPCRTSFNSKKKEKIKRKILLNPILFCFTADQP
jgi:hypothetical protein